jgi:TetR/AcrR family transcriptional regulator, transcriptional repressor for nem operon
MGRSSDAKGRILASAQELVELRGYSALGVAEICKAAGVPKGSFYHFFDSKESLALAVIDEEWDGQHATWSQILHGGGTPLRRLQQLVEATGGMMRAGQQSCGTVSGCLFGNLTLELNNQTEVIRRRLQDIFQVQVDMVHVVVTEAQERGEVCVGDTREAARSVVAQMEGRIMFAKRSTRTRVVWTFCGRTAVHCSAFSWPRTVRRSESVPAREPTGPHRTRWKQDRPAVRAEYESGRWTCASSHSGDIR